ncbi:hypothetical protein Bca4012_019100 [Brassica carinata]|uniref:Uncharacterized protein n=1 Tax=Brassica carinata TaxID=52824 RepID=A0A8X7WKE3_BRACI|nr:hypothetical protein Bca52824_002496 [Brassica carinata]
MMLQLGSGEEGGHMAGLGLSLKPGKGPGFLRRQSGHGSGKRFSDDVMKPVFHRQPMQQPAPLAHVSRIPLPRTQLSCTHIPRTQLP